MSHDRVGSAMAWQLGQRLNEEHCFGSAKAVESGFKRRSVAAFTKHIANLMPFRTFCCQYSNQFSSFNNTCGP